MEIDKKKLEKVKKLLNQYQDAKKRPNIDDGLFVNEKNFNKLILAVKRILPKK